MKTAEQFLKENYSELMDGFYVYAPARDKFELLYNAIEQFAAMPKWIPIEDNPKESGIYLCRLSLNGYLQVLVCEYLLGYNAWYYEGLDYSVPEDVSGDVTHWQPIPSTNL